jgi:hypothetical protein
MNIIFCNPELTMTNLTDAKEFYEECMKLLKEYVFDVKEISSPNHVNQLLSQDVDKNDIFLFFTSEIGQYKASIQKLIQKYNDAQSRVWAIAMYPECRKPPEPVSDRQSFDVSSRKENRNPLNNNIKAIAQVFARKIIAQTLSPLYRDEVLYFISHRRSDGEHVAAKLADGLCSLTRERNVYRDVVNVKVGDDAQKDIDEHLAVSDVVIFLQTEEARESSYIMKELCYALVNDIPVLWIQIDNAAYGQLKIRPGDGPALSYGSKEFDSPDRLEEIVDEVEDKCFQLIMNSSNQVYSYVDCLDKMRSAGNIHLISDKKSTLAYEIEYKEKTKYLYDSGVRKHYIQCFGRNPREEDFQNFMERAKSEKSYDKNDILLLLSNHGYRDSDGDGSVKDSKVIEESYDNYLMNLENVFGSKRQKRDKRIILSGAFPDCDEIYKASLMEALVVYSREIIKNGYTLVFGAHPTFQELIFGIGKLYASDVKYSIEMHMDKAYIDQYDMEDLQEKCTLILADGLQEMRENMICKEKGEMLICMGGKIKENKSEQGVDAEVELAKKADIPVALVGTVGGRSSEYALEKLTEGDWSDLNPWDKSLNEKLFYNVNHRLMIKELLDVIEEH